MKRAQPDFLLPCEREIKPHTLYASGLDVSGWDRGRDKLSQVRGSAQPRDLKPLDAKVVYLDQAYFFQVKLKPTQQMTYARRQRVKIFQNLSLVFFDPLAH